MRKFNFTKFTSTILTSVLTFNIGISCLNFNVVADEMEEENQETTQGVERKTEAISPYTIFAGSSDNKGGKVAINCIKSIINGNIYTDADFETSTSELKVNGSVDTTGKINNHGPNFSVETENENKEKQVMPDWEFNILRNAGYAEVNDDELTQISEENLKDFTLKTSGEVVIEKTDFDGVCYIISDKDITLDANNSKMPDGIVLYSKQGNIEVNGKDVDFKGIVYAPNGSVSFNNETANINGRIFGNNVNLNGNEFNVTSDVSDWKFIENRISGKDNLNDDIIDLGDIEELVSLGLITVNYNDNNEIRAIDGKFTNKPLNSAEDAAEILNSARTLFGNKFNAESDCITVQTDGEQTYYRLSSTLNGVTVFGSQIILSAKDGKATGLFSTYNKKAESTDIVATITKEEAIEKAYDDIFATYSSQIEELQESSGLTKEEVIKILRDSFETTSILAVCASDEKPILTWYVQIANNNNIYDEETDEEKEIDYTDINDYGKYVFNFIDYKYYIQANGQNAGDIIGKDDDLRFANGENVRAHGKDLLGEETDFNVQSKKWCIRNDCEIVYCMRDGERNIETCNTLFDREGNPYAGDVDMSNYHTWSNPTNVSAHVNMAKVYDFYKIILGRDSYDGKHGKIKILTNYKEKVNEDYDNASWHPSKKQFWFGNKGNYVAGVDIVGHEFTHAVTGYVVHEYDKETKTTKYGFNKTLKDEFNETGALDEACSDIMGMLIEGKDKTEEGRYQMGEATGHIRDFRFSTGEYAMNYNVFTDPEKKKEWLEKLSSENDGGAHAFCTIIDNAVYRMMEARGTKDIEDKIWAKLFYKSLFKLGASAKFTDFRYAVVSTAKSLGFTSEQQTAIKEAFDKVGVIEPEYLRIVMRWGETPRDLDSHLTGPRVDENGNKCEGNFYIYFGNKNYYDNGKYYSDVEANKEKIEEKETDKEKHVRYFAELDYDDTTSYGPEVTTIHKFVPGEYVFSVHDFSNRTLTNSTALSESDVVVSIYKGSSNSSCKLEDGTKARFTIPSSQVGNWWDVCKISIDSEGNIVINKIDQVRN